MVFRTLPTWIATAGLALLAGCAGGDPEGSSVVAADMVEFDAATGAIVGVVADAEFTPVEAATVTVGGGQDPQTTLTDAAGRFQFDYVAPGTHAIKIEREGFFETSLEVAVQAGAVSEVAVTLEALPPVEGYYETLTQVGYNGCSVSYRLNDASQTFGLDNYSVSACAIPSIFTNVWVEQVDKGRLYWHLGPMDGVSGFWSETTWQSNQATGRSIRMLWFYTRDHAVPNSVTNFDGAIGESPLRFRVTNETVNFTQDPDVCPPGPGSNEYCELGTAHYAGPSRLGILPAGGLGAMTFQRFDEFVHVFHNTALPDQFTIFEDA